MKLWADEELISNGCAGGLSLVVIVCALILYRDEEGMTASANAHRAHLGNIVLTIIIVPSPFGFWKLRFSTFLPAHGLSSSLALASLSESSVGF